MWPQFTIRSELPNPKRFWLWLGVLFFFAAQHSLFATTLTAALDRTTIALGETATLTLTYEGGSPREVPPLPNIPNLQISYVGPSTQTTVVNGAVSSSTTLNFTVVPKQIGEFSIPSFVSEVNGQKLTTTPMKLIVVKPGTSIPGAAGDQLAFLKLNLPKKQVFVGEVFKVELQIFLHSSVQNFGNFQITSFAADGFNVGKMAKENQTVVQVGNSSYTEVSLGIVLTAVKTGSFSVGPISTRMVLELPSRNRSRDPFDTFGFFNRNEQREVTLATEPQAIEVLPLPGNAPKTFTGVVGHYELAVSAGPTNVTVGDPITLRIQIAGRGNLDAVTLPEQTGWENFKTYPPTAKIETSDALGVQGTKTFEEIVTPQNTDVHALPPLAFSYFDPDQKSYRTLSQPAIPLRVKSGGSTPAPTIANTHNAGDNTPPSRDIVPIKQRLGATAQIAAPLVRQPWFLALQSVPVIALIGAFVWRQRADSIARNPRLRRKRQVEQIVRDGLNDLRRSAEANDSDTFFATLFRLLQEQLGEMLDVPASAITEAVIEDHLRPKGVAEHTLAALHELFQTCNLARYAPIKSSQELAAIIPKLEATLRQLQEVEL